jgi:hypothetical protein
MNYQAFTNDSLTMMYNCIRGALAADDALFVKGCLLFRGRQAHETSSWDRDRASG